MGPSLPAPAQTFEELPVTERWDICSYCGEQIAATLGDCPYCAPPTDRVPPAGREHDPYWRAAFCVLGGFGDDARVWAHVDLDGIDYPAMLGEGTWSGGERSVLQAAASLWNGASFSLWELVVGLDCPRTTSRVGPRTT